MAGSHMTTDRRLAENAMLRQLVDALKCFISARDAVYSLHLLHIWFRTQKYKAVYADYEQAQATVNALIRTMAVRSNSSDPSEPVLSSEEFNALMRFAEGDSRNIKERLAESAARKRKSGPAAQPAGPAYSPIVPPPSSIAPMTPSGANSIRDGSSQGQFHDKSSTNV